MKNKIIGCAMAVSLIVASASSVMASTVTHTVYPGDTMWKISMVHNLKLDSVTNLNPQVKNPNLIYPGDDIILDLTHGGKSVLKAKSPTTAPSTKASNNLKTTAKVAVPPLAPVVIAPLTPQEKARVEVEKKNFTNVINAHKQINQEALTNINNKINNNQQ